MAVATYEDVAVALGRPTSSEDEQAQIEWWLSGIELIIGARLGDVTLLDQGLLKYVEVEAVVAKVRRSGTNESSITTTVDDATITKRYENSVSAGDVWDDLWRLLDSDAGGGAFSVRPGFEADTVQWPIGTPPAFDPLGNDFP